MSMIDFTRPLNRNNLVNLASRRGITNADSLGDIELARRAMDAQLLYMKTNGPDFKGTRPWDLQDIRPLDPKQVWVGLEYETGFASREQRDAAFDFAWAAFDGLTIDGEGVGAYIGEFTFSPNTLSDFIAGQTDMDNFMRWRERVNSRHPSGASTSGSGIHLNVSTPMLRQLDQDHTQAGQQFLTAVLGTTAATISNSLRTQSTRQCHNLFGRQHPYGFAFNVGKHIEFKLFRTVDKLTDWQAYKPVMLKLVRVVEAVSEYTKEEFSVTPASEHFEYVRRNYGLPSALGQYYATGITLKFHEVITAYMLDQVSEEEFTSRTTHPRVAAAAATAAASKPAVKSKATKTAARKAA